MESRLYTQLRLVGKIKRGSSSGNKAIDIPNKSSNNKAINIPDSLINFEILPRLPVESILRFRRVCKMWNSLTREKQFVDRHMEHSVIRCNSTTNLNVLILLIDFVSQSLHCYGDDYHTQFDLSSFPWALNCEISNPCHGLICIFERGSSGDNIYLVNPSINEVVTLPQASSYTTCNLSLVYDDLIHKYKVVRIFLRPKTREQVGCEILTLGSSQTWRNIRHVPKCDELVVVGGRTIYWGNHHIGIMSTEGLVSFDIQSETFELIMLPNGWYQSGTAAYRTELYNITELGGCFCIYRSKHGIHYNYLNFCILEDIKSHKWTEHTINLDLMEDYRTTECRVFTPLSMHDGNILLANFWGIFNFYDLENGKFRGKPMCLTRGFGKPVPYFDSLISPKAIQEGGFCYS